MLSKKTWITLLQQEYTLASGSSRDSNGQVSDLSLAYITYKLGRRRNATIEKWEASGVRLFLEWQS